MAYTSVNYTLNHLVRLLSTSGLTFSKESQVPMLKLELGFLRTFVWWTAKRCPEAGNLEYLLLQIDVVARNAVNYLQSIHSDGVEDIAKDFDQLAPKVLHHIQLLKPEIEKAYIKVAESSPPMPDKLVVEFINSLIDYLMDLLRNLEPSTFVAMEALGALVTKLRFLKNLLQFAATRCTDHEKLRDLSSLAEMIAIKAAYLSFMCWFDPKDANISSIKDQLAELLRKFKPITTDVRRIYMGVLEALSPLTTETYLSDPDLASFIDTVQDSLTELQDDQPSWMASLKVNFDTFHHDLMFLSSFVEDPPTQFIESDKWDDPKDNPIQVLQGELRDWNAFDAYPFEHFTEHLALKGLLTRIQDLAVKVGHTIFSFIYVHDMEEHKLAERETAFSDLVEQMELLKSEIGVPTFTMPEVKIVRVDDQGFIRSLSRNLRELIDRQSGTIDCLKRRVQRIADELEFLSSFIKDWGERRHKHEKLRNLATNMVTVAYRAEYVTDSLLVRDGTVIYHLLCLIDVVGEMKRIRREAIMVFHDKMSYITEAEVFDSTRPSIDTTTLTMQADENDKLVVGLKDDMERLRSQLVRRLKKLDVISIVGMAGVGKTTIARKLFTDRRIVHHFDCQSFIKVSQVYDAKKLVRQILRDFSVDDDTFDRLDVDDLRYTLHKFLRARRFFIVVDDLWAISAWDDLRVLFPDDNNGSRILLTTRSRELASYANRHSEPYYLRFLTLEESWELFLKKIFQQESCPPELEDVGRKIVRQCQGLPLMIVLIADTLARKKNNIYSWMQVCESIPIDKGEFLLSIIEQQYSDLPDYLRQCFLYFGAFLLDEEIPVSKLIRLWTAEGFVLKSEEKSFEDVAMEYLMDLIGRNLVTVCRRSSEGIIKSCKIHDRMHGLCCTKAKEENFFQLMEWYGEVSTPLGSIHHGVDPNCSNVPHSVTTEHRRLFISSNWADNISLEVSGPLVRSLVLSGERSNFSRSDISFLYQNLIFLKVLDLEHVNVGDAFPIGLEKMALLRYLAVRGEMTSIPSSIGSLKQLETFVIIGLQGEVAVPDEIWDLTNLRHLHIDTFACIGAPEYRQGFSGKCQDLSSLSTLTIMDEIDTTLIMRRFPNLEKLKCKIFSSHDSSANTKMLPGLDELTGLNSLKLIYQGMPKSYIFTFPPVLRRLTLSGFYLGLIQTSTIGMLPVLEVLKLLFTVFEYREWEIGDDYFPMLKILKLEKPDLRNWIVSEDALPNLERLELQNCRRLREIPSCIGDLNTLKEIKVEGCSPSVEKSAMDIRELQEEYGNTEFQLFISRKEATL